MKKIAVLLMSLLLVLTCMAGVFSVSAEDELPEAQFTYDFTVEGAATAYGFGTDDVMDCEVEYDGADYTTFKAVEGEKEAGDSDTDTPDCYFKFGKESQPGVFCTEAKFIIIKYRTTVACKGQIYTGRSDKSSWAQDGNELHWDWVADGEWNLALLDATNGAWAATAGEGQTFENFRLDPMDGAPDGSTIDIAFIKFFDSREAADEFRQISDPIKYTFYTATFHKEDGSVYKTVYFTAADTEIDEPSVPRKKGYDGVWGEYTLVAENIDIYPVYTAKETEPEEENKPVETEPVETEPVESLPVETETEEVTTLPAEVETESTPAVESETEKSGGCGSVIATGSVVGVMALAAGVVAFRKKRD